MTVMVRRLRLRGGHRYPRHAHEGWSFGLVGSGSVRLRTAGSWCVAVEGLATVLRPGEVHEGVVDERTGLAYATVSVPEEVVRGVCDSTGTPDVSSLLLETARPVGSLVAAASAAVAEERRERLAGAVAWVFADAPARAGAGVRPEQSLATAAKGMLDDGFAGPVSVRAVAERLGVAPATVIRSFSRRYGLPPYAYVVSRRVEMARQLLDGGVGPAEAAERAGFYDQAHLNRHFTRVVGVTPGAYRRG
jgi:AraC-like DNA-binding protein